MTSVLQLAWGASTDRGRRRAENEDAFLAAAPIFVVADGMGGHELGAEASRRALTGFEHLIGREDVTPPEVEAAFQKSVLAVTSLSTGGAASAGSTLSGVVACRQAGDAYWLVLNIGDSRTYRLADDVLEQISVDHSAVQQLLDSGQVRPEDVERHPQRNVVTRAIGAGSRGAPDYWMIPAALGDRIMVCSDGLTKELSAAEIAAVLRDEATAAGAADRLVRDSLNRGGRDNITVVVVDALGGVAAVDDDTVPSHAADNAARPSALERESGEHHAHL